MSFLSVFRRLFHGKLFYRSGSHLHLFFRIKIRKAEADGSCFFGSKCFMHQRCTVCSCSGYNSIFFLQPVTDLGRILISNVQCYNDDTGKWMTLDDAKAYGGTMNLYVYDGVVRIVEVKA